MSITKSTIKITFGELERVLRRLGYSDTESSRSVVFRHPDSQLLIILPRMERDRVLRPIELLSVQNSLANAGMVDKDDFDALFGPLELWHAIVDAEANYHLRHGHPPKVLKLPVLRAYDLAKLQRHDFDLADEVMQDGIDVFKEKGLLGVPVQLIPGAGEFVFE